MNSVLSLHPPSRGQTPFPMPEGKTRRGGGEGGGEQTEQHPLMPNAGKWLS